MAEQRIPATPNNFNVWFHYFLGAPDDLKHAIDILIDNRRAFDSRVNQDLFATYIEPSDITIAATASGQLQAVLMAAKQYLANAIEDNQSHMQAISDVADQTNAGLDPKGLVSQLIAELNKAAARASKLEERFDEKNRELDTIRDSLSKSEQRAKTDTLTGLPNRRALDEFFRVVQIDAMEKGEPLSVLMLDVDHFKKFNDNFGHGVGDQVLKLIGQVLHDKVREGDLPARYGGEELLAVLPGANLGAATAVAERVRRSIAECHITRRSTGELLPTITVSIGVAQFQPGESMNELIERCDRALYRAKQSGRNRVVTEAELETALAAAS
ncbi:MAG: GGDEF domain-containing protein [Bradyrhizobium sp.]|uniref:GGDEF domain-containing protein n=1 Tax=Bradyrhizobium sp. TaxID=376 RepID=UPI0025C23CA7|nr:GGDEF domain-containing protein [Bradyrhizobium sp.]MBI5261901.1 GGDEF domain-containing protein [Bradyrhizobium sp.]